MPKVQFPMYLEEKDHEEYTKLAKEKGISLTQYIRDCLYASKENPQFLNPTTAKTNLDEIINALEISANERLYAEESFKNQVLERLDNVEEGLQTLMKKAKIPKKERDQIKGQKDVEDVIFEDD